ncbi:MAG: hypothetical protein M1831_000357 [Alyxoria varia]|nr:MAG: hypothetical protein M1831_000357 [Alyxoria varia]
MATRGITIGITIVVFGVNVAALPIWRGHDAEGHRKQVEEGIERPVSHRIKPRSRRSIEEPLPNEHRYVWNMEALTRHSDYSIRDIGIRQFCSAFFKYERNMTWLVRSLEWGLDHPQGSLDLDSPEANAKDVPFRVFTPESPPTIADYARALAAFSTLQHFAPKALMEVTQHAEELGLKDFDTETLQHAANKLRRKQELIRSFDMSRRRRMNILNRSRRELADGGDLDGNVPLNLMEALQMPREGRVPGESSLEERRRRRETAVVGNVNRLAVPRRETW